LRANQTKGEKDQTRPDNFGPLTRTVHRAKTTGRWRLKQPKSGTFWWRSPSNQTYRVTNQATDDLREWSPCERALLWRFDEQPPPA
jgi:hypothetical protein